MLISRKINLTSKKLNGILGDPEVLGKQFKSSGDTNKKIKRAANENRAEK